MTLCPHCGYPGLYRDLGSDLGCIYCGCLTSPLIERNRVDPPPKVVEPSTYQREAVRRVVNANSHS